MRILLFLWSLLCFQIFGNDKWIVITTINHPTQAVTQLAAMPGWRVVIVADKKTPTDWHYPNCDFLSIEEQRKLPYRIVKLLPWNHYSRKNIGYLYAIQHGARIIYDTDDDNIPLFDAIQYCDKEQSDILVCKTKHITVNPYEYFGQPTIWPRGYPLQKILMPPSYSLASEQANVYIQQGIVNGDPDVDAIFRLTRSLDITFETKPPICFDFQTFCQFNTQNTIFHYEAFWGLVIPMTPSFRVCDIWRGYWVQRLLWDINGKVAYLSPSAIQVRNEHDLLNDFSQEIDLYLKSGKLLHSLAQWKTDEILLPDRMLDLFQYLIVQEYFKPAELILTYAWLEDLKECGYQFPSIKGK